MAEKLKLRFRVLNAGIATREIPIEHEGQPALLKQSVLHVDAEPLDGTVRTLELDLPASLAGKIAAGTVLNATFEFELPLPDAAANSAGG